MPVIVVANPKGGVGKSTVATQIAGWYAAQGRAVMLGDLDRQQSARHWLALRPPQAAPIRGWDLADGDRVRPPKGSTHLVIDTPAGLHGKRLDAVLKIADRIVIPLQPSPFDMAATHAFLQVLGADKTAQKRAGQMQIGLVAVRTKEHTHALDHLHTFLVALGQPPLAGLRDTQNYAHLAARGLTLWDVAASRVERDLTQWQPLIDWLPE